MPRIRYDDRQRFPFVIKYGVDKVWARYRTLWGAQAALAKLRDLIDEAK